MDQREVRRSAYPLTIPDALLNSDAMRQACAARNFREIFRLVNRRTGSSHADIAAAIGKMTSSRVSDIIRGVRDIRGHQVIERVADGFGIPGEMLGLPTRPWEGFPKAVDVANNTHANVRGVGQHRAIPHMAMAPSVPIGLSQTDPNSSLSDMPDSESVDWDPPHGPWDDQIVIIFDGGELNSTEVETLRPHDSELSACGFFTPEDAITALRPRIRNRVTQAIEALATGRPRYMESGHALW